MRPLTFSDIVERMKKTAVYSDLSNAVVETLAQIRVTVGDLVHTLDADAKEVAELINKASRHAKRAGRPSATPPEK